MMITKESAAMISSLLFQSADVIHICHLREKGKGSFAGHIALGDLYSVLRDGADEITEMLYGYIGIYDFSIPESKWTDKLTFVRLLRARMVDCRQYLQSTPDVLNKFEEVMGVVSRTIYKLENLE